MAAMRLSRGYSDLGKAVGKFEGRQDAALDRYNERDAVRCRDILKPTYRNRKHSPSTALCPLHAAPGGPDAPTPRKRRRNELLPQAQQRIAYPGPGSVPEKGSLTSPMCAAGIVARQHHISEPCVVYTRNGMAEFQTQTNEERIQHEIQLLRTCNMKLPYTIDRLKWDETTHLLASVADTGKAAPMPSGAAAICDAPPGPRRRVRGKSHRVKLRQAKSYARPSRQTVRKNGKHGSGPYRHRVSEQIMVSRRDYIFGNPNMSQPDRAIAVAQPPALLHDNGAACIKKAHEQQQVLSHDDLRSISHVQWVIREADNAKANCTVIQAQRAASDLFPFVILLAFWCFIHQLHICAMLVLLGIDGKPMTFLNSAYCTAHVLRAPGYFLRVLDEVEGVLQDRNGGLSIVFGPPPVGARASNVKVLEMAGFDVHDQDYQFLLRILNDYWHLQYCVHYCECETPCDFNDLVERLAIVLTRVIFGRMPAIPIAARWMLVMATARWFKLVFAIHGIGKRAILRALNPAFIKDVLASSQPRGECSDEMPRDDFHVDPGLQMTTERDAHQKALGKRLARSVEWIESPSTERDADIILSTVGPVNYVTAYMLDTERLRNRNRLSPEVPAPLLDLSNPDYSAIVVARQAYAGLLMQPASASLTVQC